MAYTTPPDFTPFDVLTAAQLDILSNNDISFNDGTGIGTGAIDSANITATGLIQGVQGVGSSPAPTSETDVASSSVTFSLSVASTLLVFYGGEFQINAGAYRSLTVYLNIDGSNVGNATRSANQSSDTLSSCVDMYKVNLASGSHTIKLRNIANTAGTTAFNGGWWYALTFSQ